MVFSFVDLDPLELGVSFVVVVVLSPTAIFFGRSLNMDHPAVWASRLRALASTHANTSDLIQRVLRPNFTGFGNLPA
jgi:hypothetical protein